MRRKISIYTCFLILFAIFQLTGCGKVAYGDTNTGYLSGKTFAIVVKSAGNENLKKMTEGFKEVIEGQGGKVIVKEPSYATNDQTELVSSLISQDVSGISIAVNNPASLEPVLSEAKDRGINIIAFDSPASQKSRDIFVNQVETGQIGRALADAVYDLADGSGQWAILSSTSVAPNQNQWIESIKSEIEGNKKYKDLALVDVAYGNDDLEKSKAEVMRLVKEYPQLKVICAPTTVGILSAAEVLSNTDSGIRLTGLGLPTEMPEYLGNVCPYMFFWDTKALGRLTAYTAIALENGVITGKAGESFTAGDMGNFTVKESMDGGTEVANTAIRSSFLRDRDP